MHRHIKRFPLGTPRVLCKRVGCSMQAAGAGGLNNKLPGFEGSTDADTRGRGGHTYGKLPPYRCAGCVCTCSSPLLLSAPHMTCLVTSSSVNQAHVQPLATLDYNCLHHNIWGTAVQSCVGLCIQALWCPPTHLWTRTGRHRAFFSHQSVVAPRPFWPPAKQVRQRDRSTTVDTHAQRRSRTRSNFCQALREEKLIE